MHRSFRCSAKRGHLGHFDNRRLRLLKFKINADSKALIFCVWGHLPHALVRGVSDKIK
jgi:hypothetical protein